MPQRDELAKVAVTLHVRCQQRERRARRILRFVFRVSERLCPESRRRVSRHGKFGTQHYADNRFYFCFLRQLAKLYRSYKPFVSVSATAGMFCSTAAAII